MAPQIVWICALVRRVRRFVGLVRLTLAIIDAPRRAGVVEIDRRLARAKFRGLAPHTLQAAGR